MNGTFYWNELITKDVEAAKSFYGETLGWSFEPFGDEGLYWIIKKDETVVGGILDANLPEFQGIPHHWFSYVSVENIDETLEKVVQAGGKVLKDIFEIPTVGRIAVIQAKDASMIGYITPEVQDS